MENVDYENMSPEAATEEIETTMSNPEHLYHSPPTTIGRKAAVEHISKLYLVKNNELHPPEKSPSELAETPEEFRKAKSAEKFRPAEVKAMQDGLEEISGQNEERQRMLAFEIRREIEQVNTLMEGSDVNADEVCEDPTEAKLEGYKMMRLLGQHDYASLTPLITQDARSLGMPPNQVAQIQDFMATATPGDPLSDDIINILVRHIYKAKKSLKENPVSSFGG